LLKKKKREKEISNLNIEIKSYAVKISSEEKKINKINLEEKTKLIQELITKKTELEKLKKEKEDYIKSL
jgi:hypothetical protein